MAGITKRLYGPAYLTNAAANVYNNASASLWTKITKIHIANVSGGAVTVTLYIGATGGSVGGTEFLKGLSIAANDEYNSYDVLRLDSTDFLTGLASAATSLVITIEGELNAV